MVQTTGDTRAQLSASVAVLGKLVLTVLAIVGLASCSFKAPGISDAQINTDLGLLETLPSSEISYQREVRPILQNRCVVCHGCYDAPCQLKLSSPAGIERGASTEKVYNGARFATMSPTRLYIDAKSTTQWRERGFHSILNEGEGLPQSNLDQSVMYQMLRLKQRNPQPRLGMLPENIDLSLGRAETCPTIDSFDSYAEKFPNQGMPFAMPNLNDEEYRTLVQWLAQGAPMPGLPGVSAAVKPQVDAWEAFLNRVDNKHRLVARYLYEHLFLGHMHFSGSDEREFYRLVRSSTPPGQPVDEIATVRPYDDPGTEFYYRLLRYPGDIVAKTHLVYELSEQRLARYRELFIDPDYEVVELPSREPLVAANPFKAFAAIPPRSRYRFLLDDARYFIEGFIKGPVCRGMIALNVIEDHFWVTFLHPDRDQMLDHPEFLQTNSDYLQIPSAQGGQIRLLGAWKKYRELEQRYVAARFSYYEAMNQHPLEDAMKFLWDGEGRNPNAALTVFRHFDSASVNFGFVGDYPETTWVIDYPLLERIHYLLVAGFNVFGNLKHQLNTRLYMDFLRMEGEDAYLAFLPTSHRRQIRDSWYLGMRQGLETVLEETDRWMSKDVVTGYRSDDPQNELYQQMEAYFAPVLGAPDYLNRCDTAHCVADERDETRRRADSAMRAIRQVSGITLAAFPDVAYVRVRTGGDPDQDLMYTLIRNKAYKHVTSIFKDEGDTAIRDYSNDTMTVVDWVEGAYPNFFFDVTIDQVEEFAERYAALQTLDEYRRFVSVFGVRRTHPGFWELADWFQDQYRREQPVLAGLLDLNRYQNR